MKREHKKAGVGFLAGLGLGVGGVVSAPLLASYQGQQAAVRWTENKTEISMAVARGEESTLFSVVVPAEGESYYTTTDGASCSEETVATLAAAAERLRADVEDAAGDCL